MNLAFTILSIFVTMQSTQKERNPIGNDWNLWGAMSFFRGVPQPSVEFRLALTPLQGENPTLISSDPLSHHCWCQQRHFPSAASPPYPCPAMMCCRYVLLSCELWGRVAHHCPSGVLLPHFTMAHDVSCDETGPEWLSWTVKSPPGQAIVL